MIRFITALIFLFPTFFSLAQNLTIYRSESSVDETAQKIVQVIKDKDLIYFETVSHDQIARERGVNLDPTRSILFEDPDLTTELLLCKQTAAHDLPLEIIVWEENGDVYIGFMDPKVMLKRFMISGCNENLELISKLMVRVTMDALRAL